MKNFGFWLSMTLPWRIKKMRKYPDKKRLNRPICENCHFLTEYMGQRYCRIVRPFINPETGICEDWKKKILKEPKQISIEDLTN